MADTTRIRTVFGIIAAFAIGTFGAVAFATPAAATSVTVSTAAELYAEIAAANTNPGLDYITLDAGILLTGALPLITDDLEIEGANFTIDAAVNSVFVGINSDVTLRNINVNNTDAAYAFSLFDGNAVLENASFDDAPVYIEGSGISVAITSSTFNNSGSRQGIAIVVDSNSVVAIDNSEASGNSQEGFDVGISQASTLTISGSTALNNSYVGIRAYAATASTIAISDSRADDNNVHGFDVYVDESSGSVTESTATGNGDNGFNAGAAFSATLTLSNLSSTSNGRVGIYLSTEDGSTTTARAITSALNDNHSLRAMTVNGGHVIIEDSVFTTSVNGFGAYMYLESGGEAQLARVTLSGNASGGIMLDDTAGPGRNSVSLVESTISDNGGSGFITDGGVGNSDIGFDRTTISGNTASSSSGNEGGGIYAILWNDSSITVLNSTVSGNTAEIVGGIFLTEEGSVDSQLFFSHSTIANNVSTSDGPGGLAILAGQYTVDHSAIAGNLSDGTGWDVDADLIADGVINYSLVQNPTSLALTAMNAGTGNIINTGARLGPLANNGGHTLTHVPLADSPLSNAGNPAISGAPATDQRGLQRIVGTIDIGAVEVQQALAITGADEPLGLLGAAAVLLFSGGVMVMMRRRFART